MGEMFTLLCGVLVPLLGLIMWWWNELWYIFSLKFQSLNTTLKLPPGHMGLPYFGEMFKFLWYFKFIRRPDEFINKKRRKYGDGIGIYRTHLFGSPAIIACLPSVIKFILQSTESFISEWPSTEIMGPSNLAVVQGKAHTRIRNYVSNAINRPDPLRRIALHVQPLLVASLKSWAHKGRIKVLDETRKLIFQNIGKLFLSLEASPLLVTMDRLFEGLMKGIRAQRLNFPGTAYHHALQCRKKLDAIFRKELEMKRNRSENEENENDLMDGLMQMKDEEGKKLSDEEVIDNIVGLVVAGYESTALASMWLFYYLAKFPRVLQKVREENLLINQKKSGEFITSEDVSKLKYTNKVVEETLRMANIALCVFRTATKDVEYKGYKIPKGWRVLLWVRYLHTDPQNFNNPLYFNPDRWDTPARSGTYQPFGGGLRTCPGNMLAKVQLAILVHHLSIGYKWELVNPNMEMTYLSHPRPADGVEVAFSKLY